jgi:drug/metabolite transporter (DMT)-like permease
MEDWVIFSTAVLAFMAISRIGFKLLGSFSPFIGTLLIEGIATITGVILFLIFRPSLELGSIPTVGLAIIGVSVAIADFFFIKAIQAGGSLGIVTTIMNLSTIFVAFIGFLVFKEHLSLLNWFGIFLGVIGLILLTM